MTRSAAFLILLLCASAFLSACSRPPSVIGIDNPVTPAETVTTATRHEIFIATSRERSSVAGEFYSSERARDIGLAKVTVSIPPVHEVGVVERADELPPDPNKHFMAVDPVVFSSDRQFISAINAELATRAPQDRDVLVFIHGFNNTLTDSALRVAQFVEDSGFGGVTVLFSWASAGRISQYVYDLNSALAARPQLEKTSALLSQTNASGFDVFAHSMGTFLLVEVLLQSDLQGTLGDTGRLKNVMLAAPDIDVDVFHSQLGQIRNNPGNLYVFVSEDDSALSLSRRVSGGINRVGDSPPEELDGLGITIIDLSEIEDSEDGTHSKFAASPEVVQLIGRSLDQSGYDKHRSDTVVLDLDPFNILPELSDFLSQ